MLTSFLKVSIVASYIKERTKNAQFIVISLRNNMVSAVDCRFQVDIANMFSSSSLLPDLWVSIRSTT